MNNFCKYCGMCCKIIPAKNGMVLKDGCQTDFDNLIPVTEKEAVNINEQFVRDIKTVLGETDFYKCKYICEDNSCKNPDKPDSCADYPSTGLAIIPEECCYIGEVFIKREELKQKVRKYKEEIIHYEALIASGDKDKDSYQKIIKSLQKFINKYSIYGSDNW